MGLASEHEPVLLTLTVFSRYPEALSWAEDAVNDLFGPLLYQSNLFDFDFTSYYKRQMGDGLKLKLMAFDTLSDPRSLPRIKLKTNELEEAYARSASHPEPRPLNLDPGYLTPAKFVLATTKDASHRLYLDRGIFAEVTLYYMHGAWHEWPWTYPNYQEECYKEFLTKCRNVLMERR